MLSRFISDKKASSVFYPKVSFTPHSQKTISSRISTDSFGKQRNSVSQGRSRSLASSNRRSIRTADNSASAYAAIWEKRRLIICCWGSCPMPGLIFYKSFRESTEESRVGAREKRERKRKSKGPGDWEKEDREREETARTRIFEVMSRFTSWLTTCY